MPLGMTMPRSTGKRQSGSSSQSTAEETPPMQVTLSMVLGFITPRGMFFSRKLMPR